VLPNFFLAGAPKAGTTSLYHYLEQHPQIYMCPIKEPCYFASEFRPESCAQELMPGVERGRRELRKYLDGPMCERRFGGMVTGWEDYVRLFRHVRGETAIGEASAGYLWSETAARNIHAKIPAAKVLLMLRNPADRAYSQYLHQVAVGGLRFSFRRQIEANLQNRSRKFSLQYPLLEFGLYHGQVTRFLDVFPRQNMCIHLYDDYRADAAATMANIFRFLGVDDTFTSDTSQRHLELSLPRLSGVTHTLRRLGIWQAIKRITPLKLMPAARRVAFTPRSNLAMDPEDRRYLVDYYAADIRKLATLLDRDLTAWLQPDAGGKKAMPPTATGATPGSTQEIQLPKFTV
jgi:Sulfotransferase family